jgi:hypothetical protein
MHRRRLKQAVAIGHRRDRLKDSTGPGSTATAAVFPSLDACYAARKEIITGTSKELWLRLGRQFPVTYCVPQDGKY